MIIKSINKSVTTKKLVISSVVLAVLIATFIILELTGMTHITNLSRTTTDTNNSASSDSANKKKFIEDNTKNSGIYKGPAASDISLSSTIEADGSVTILTQLKNSSDGRCDLTITSSDNTYSQSVPVIYQPSFSTCAGFNVPKNTLPVGNWQISLTVSSKGTTNSKTIYLVVR